MMKNKLAWLPNFISILRLILLIPYTALFLAEKSTNALILITIIIIVSDKLDGALARHLKSESALGELLDSIADSIFVLLTWFLFYIKGMYGLGMLIIVLMPRLIMGMSVALYKIIHKKWHGQHFLGNKIGAVLNCFAILWLILNLPYGIEILIISTILNYVATAMSEASRYKIIKPI